MTDEKAISLVKNRVGIEAYTRIMYEGEVVCPHDVLNRVVEVASKYQWHICSNEGNPPEHDSMFAKFKGTAKWKPGMFEKRSDDVNVALRLVDDSIITKTSHTMDGVWECLRNSRIAKEVVAWADLPKFHEYIEEDKE